jgi:hypothetical protein
MMASTTPTLLGAVLSSMLFLYMNSWLLWRRDLERLTLAIGKHLVDIEAEVALISLSLIDHSLICLLYRLYFRQEVPKID